MSLSLPHPHLRVFLSLTSPALPHLLSHFHSEKAMETDADTDVTMVPANIETEAESAFSSSTLLASSSSSFKKNNKRFEIKKWNAVSLWAWDFVVDICAICRNHIMDLCIECQANQASATSEECTIAWGKN